MKRKLATKTVNYETLRKALIKCLRWSLKKLKDKVNTIEQALQSDDATYYIYCPECKARIELNKVKILVDKQNAETKE